MKPTKEQLLHWIEYMQWNTDWGEYSNTTDYGKTEKEVLEFLLLILPLFLEDSDDGIVYTHEDGEYKIELKKNVWSYLLNVTHLTTGLMRGAEETTIVSGLFYRLKDTLPFEHLSELKQVIQEYEATHDMDNYRKSVAEVKNEMPPV